MVKQKTAKMFFVCAAGRSGEQMSDIGITRKGANQLLPFYL